MQSRPVWTFKSKLKILQLCCFDEQAFFNSMTKRKINDLKKTGMGWVSRTSDDFEFAKMNPNDPQDSLAPTNKT